MSYEFESIIEKLKFKLIMKKFLFTLLIAIFWITNSLSQKESNFWYFGNQAGLNFDNGNPVSISDGALNNQEACSTMSDSIGNLLFYTDGMHVWNKNHIQMPNGVGLAGAPSSTSTFIIPYPGNNNLYYIITVDENVGEKGLCFSIVDMQKEDGLGDVDILTKNTLLFKPSSEKIAVTQHKNGIDYWLIVHKWQSNEFVSYLINQFGIQANSPVVSIRGTVYEGHVSNSRGCLKVSPQGDKLVAAIEGMNIIEMFDFDNTTGIVSNHVKFPGEYKSAYGVEFSIDGKFLYCSERWENMVYQFNLGAGSNEEIFTSKTIIGSNGTGMQLGMDGRIYLASGSSSLSVINNPSVAGTGSDYNAYNLSIYRQSYEGLPSFIASYFAGLKFTYKKACPGSATQFYIPNIKDIESVEWCFNYPSNNSSDKSTAFSPSHIYSPGTYRVRLVATYSDHTETAEQTIKIDAIPELNLPSEKEICNGDFIELHGFSSYEWSNGSWGNKFYPPATDTYWVIAKDRNGCSPTVQKKYIDITVNPKPVISYSKTNVSSVGGNNGSINLTVAGGIAPYKYLWQNGETTEDLNSLKAGGYSIKVEDTKHCAVSEGINIEGPFSCEATSHEWSKLIYSESKKPSGFGRDVATDNFGNIYLTGQGGYTFTQSGIDYNGKNNSDLLLSKFDNTGKLMWIKYFPSDIDYFISKIAIDKEENVFITGYFKGTIDFDGTKITALENDDIFIAKFDKNGQTLWAKRAGGTLKDQAFGIATDNQGNAYILGQYEGSAVFKDTTIISKGQIDLFLAKYNLTGDLEWVHSIGGNYSEYACSISINPLNDIYIAVRSDSWVCYADNLSISPGENFTAKYKTDGTIDKFIKLPYGTNQIFATSKNLFITGDYRGGTIFGTFTLNGPIDQYATVISKLSFNGDFIWSKQSGSMNVGNLSDFFVDQKENSYLLEYFWEDTYFEGQLFKYENYPDHTSPCVAIAKYDLNGNFIYADKITISSYPYSQVWTTALCADKMQNIFITGGFNDSPKFGNLTAPFGYSGIFVAKHSDNKLKTLIPETSLGCTNKTAPMNLTVEGGTQPYKYLWSNGATTQNIDVSNVGSYYVTVTDSKSCVATDSINIKISDSISLKTQIVNASSDLTNDGEINLIVIGGEAPFNYNWSNGATTEDLNNLLPGEYSVEVTDKNGCTASTSAIVTKSDCPIKLKLLGTYDCAGSTNGVINLTIEGGNGTYQTKWSNGATTEDILGLSAGWYFVTVQDDEFITSDSILLESKNIIQTNLKTENTCEGSSNGSIVLNISGGTQPYSFNWSNNRTSQNINELAVGLYNVIVTDSKGCKAYDTIEVFQNKLPDPAGNILGTTDFCIKTGVKTFFNTSIIKNATYYNWKISPKIAGEIIGDGTNSYISWNQSFYGSASIVVSGKNHCGNGLASEPLYLNILNPSAKLECSGDFPEGGSIPVNIAFTGEAPWNLSYTDGTDTYNITTYQNPYQTIVSKPGNYKILSLSDANCTGYNLGEEITINYGPNSINDLTFSDYISIYPNPSKENVYFKLKRPVKGELQIEVVDIKGSKVLIKKIESGLSGQEFNLTIPYKGIYVINLLFEDKIRSSKLVIE
jgi:hypothetical protein